MSRSEHTANQELAPSFGLLAQVELEKASRLMNERPALDLLSTVDDVVADPNDPSTWLVL